MAFSILLVDYNSIINTIKYIGECERYLKSFAKKQYIIVDNSMNGAAYSYIKENYSFNDEDDFEGNKVLSFTKEGAEIVVISTLENIGYARGNNIAAKYSKQYYKDNNFLISNNDIVFEKEFNIDIVDELLAEYAVIGPDILTRGEHTNPIYYTSSWYNLFGIYLNSFLPKKIKPRCDKVPYTFVGCFWFFNGEFFCKIGGFDEGTFLYYEEQIFGERIKKNNGKVLYLEDLKVIHNHNFSRKNALEEARLYRIFYNSARYYEKEYIGVSWIIMVLSRVWYEILFLLYIPERAILKIIYDIRKG